MLETWKIVKHDIREYWIAALCIVLLYCFMHKFFGGLCLSVIITGFPCPGCGMTRAAMYLVSGHFYEAYQMNPAVFLWAILVGYFGWFRYILHRKAPAMKQLIVMICIITILIFVYRMWRYFPDKVPLTYTRGRLLERLIPGYYNMISRIL